MGAARRHFPQLKNGFTLQTDDLDVCGGELTDISPEIWEMAIDMLSSVVIKEEPVPLNTAILNPVLPGVASLLTVPSNTGGGAADGHAVVEVNCEGVTRNYRVKLTTPLSRVFSAAVYSFGIHHSMTCEDDWAFYYDGDRIYNKDDTPATLNFHDGDTLEIEMIKRLQLKGGKPVIYLFSPSAIDVSVRLTLTREWDLSVIYPVVPAKRAPAGGESIQWDVRTHPDGSLTEHTTGLGVAYLFWEALTNNNIPPSPPSSPVLGHSSPMQAFSPTTCDLTPADSVLLRVADITPYLDSALRALGLHTEARTSFITYWLPAFLKHTHVALRFVPQAAYEPAARLDITPAPDVVTRVFMLFKGVPSEKVDAWSASSEGPERWREVVGVDVERALDADLFRVLEWGGMEVLGR
ncbi:hypothetical protein FB451DRAFT_201882 [Mycena latifolia]|nr:hypothetical protein FB451DRAFT_201882 [Mycena latifolia]